MTKYWMRYVDFQVREKLSRWEIPYEKGMSLPRYLYGYSMRLGEREETVNNLHKIRDYVYLNHEKVKDLTIGEVIQAMHREKGMECDEQFPHYSPYSLPSAAIDRLIADEDEMLHYFDSFVTMLLEMLLADEGIDIYDIEDEWWGKEDEDEWWDDEEDEDEDEE